MILSEEILYQYSKTILLGIDMSPLCQASAEFYVKSTTELRPDLFKGLIYGEITVDHQTNDETPVHLEGAEAVIKAFNEKIFKNTSDVVRHGYSIKECEGGIKVKIKVTETKENEGVKARFHFIEKTILTFHPQGFLRSINSRVTRTPVNT